MKWHTHVRIALVVVAIAVAVLVWLALAIWSGSSKPCPEFHSPGGGPAGVGVGDWLGLLWDVVQGAIYVLIMSIFGMW